VKGENLEALQKGIQVERKTSKTNLDPAREKKHGYEKGTGKEKKTVGGLKD